MTAKRDWFVEYKSKVGDSVYMDNNHECEIISTGSMLLKLSDNREVLLKGVRHAPKLNRNLISLGMLDDLGCSIHAEKGCLEILKHGRAIVTAKKRERLYIVINVNRPKYALISDSERNSELQLWHQRLSHISDRGLDELLK